MSHALSASRSTLVLLSFAAHVTVLAQSLGTGQGTCGFDEGHQRLMSHNAAYRQRVEAFNTLARGAAPMDERGSGTFKVPVVVHVMDIGTSATAVTDDQIRAGIKLTNEYWRKVAGSAGDGAGVDMGIEFVLAVRDPQGNCTTGITRTDMTWNADYVNYGVAHNGAQGMADADLKAYTNWDPTQYYNIWLVSEIDNGGPVAGYAFFASSHGSAEDGTIMLANYMISDVLAHELGHAFNLYHTFEGDDDGTQCPDNTDCTADGDQVCDVPPHIRPSACDPAGTNACDGGSLNSLHLYNYMNYSPCSTNMFTNGQRTRAQLAMTSQRASFLAVNGNVSLVPPGAPQLDFQASAALLCGTGQTVTLEDLSFCLPNTYLNDAVFPGITFAWSITNGTDTYNSTARRPTFTLNSAGIYNATLTVTTTLGTFTRTENGVVVVAATPVSACSPTSNNECNCAQTVNNVVFNTISNATSTINNVAYTDFSCTKNTILAAGGTYQLSVTIRAGGSGSESLNGYIDYNNNGVFEDPSERVIQGSTAANTTSTINANVTLPGGAVTNTLLRMRLYGEAGTLSANERNCQSSFFIGDVEDYGVYISNTVAGVSIAASPGSTITYGTNVTFTPTPVNGGSSPVYTWYRDGAPVSTGATYQSNDLMPGTTIQCEMASNLAGVLSSPALSNTITMTVTGPPLSEFSGTPLAICTGGSVTFTDASLLSPTSWAWTFPGGTPSSSTAQNPVITYNTAGTYNVTLVASNANGTGTTMTKTGYVTVFAAPASACTHTRSNSPGFGIGITNVSLNTIDNTTVYNGAAMNNYTCSQSTALETSTNYAISVTGGPFNNQWFRVYIDYNNNGVFTDPGELVFSPANAMGTVSGNFTTPASPTMNTLLRMRVISDFVNTTPGPCTNVQYGQSEDYGVYFTTPANIQVSPKVFLEGPYNASTGLMSDAMRIASLIPTSQPYTGLGYTFIGSPGAGGTLGGGVLTTTGNNAIVDWVVVELRNTATPSVVVASCAALVQRDGDVVALDGTSPVSIATAAGTYHVAVRHRNHLGAMTLGGVALSSTPATVDFTQAATNTWGTNARKSIAGAFPAQVLWAGDVTFNGQVKYTGGGNDRDPVLTTVGSTTPNNTVNSYSTRDVNLNGQVKYTGSSNDRDPILLNVGSTTPNNTRSQQLP